MQSPVSAEPTSGCVPLNPNPDSFENGLFPEPPWSTSGSNDLKWAITQTKAFDGTYSIRSPNLESTAQPGISYASVRGYEVAFDFNFIPDIFLIQNATLQICPNFPGGSLRFEVYPSVVPPFDMLVIFVNGQVGQQLADVHEWTSFEIDLEESAEEFTIDFSYQYNRFGLNPLPPAVPDRREGESCPLWFFLPGLHSPACAHFCSLLFRNCVD